MIVRPPVIVIGMHRSGTTMVMRMLAELGLFVGAQIDGNCEPPFFRAINDWLLTQCGGRWDEPRPIRHLLESPRTRSLVTDYLRSYLSSPRSVSYFGMRGLWRKGREAVMTKPWGWKDPRNTFTLPIWLDLFPQARVIHIYRHGIDVAKSLATRWEKSVQKRESRFHARRRLYAIRPQTGGFAESYRCGTLEGALSLWEEYVTESRRQVSAMGSGAIEVQYEAFLEQPAAILEQLSEFAGLTAGKEQVIHTASGVRRERAFAYREESDLLSFARQKADQLAVCGYTA
jgi:hypothetical protein